jgi:hypothetical protein
MTNTKKHDEAILTAHKEITGWATADWTHEFKQDGSSQLDGDGDAILCSGGSSACESCQDAEIAAVSAKSCADEALSYWLSGEPLLSLRAAREATSIEGEFGDDPCYRPLRDSIEGAISELAEDEEWAEANAEAASSI